MIEITLDSSKDSFKIIMNGHAGYGEFGKDIICAAASMLFYTMMERLSFLDERAIKTCTYSNGTAMLQVKMTDKRIEECIETILTGYRILAREYPNNVKIII